MVTDRTFSLLFFFLSYNISYKNKTTKTQNGATSGTERSNSNIPLSYEGLLLLCNLFIYVLRMALCIVRELDLFQSSICCQRPIGCFNLQDAGVNGTKSDTGRGGFGPSFVIFIPELQQRMSHCKINPTSDTHTHTHTSCLQLIFFVSSCPA